MSRFLVGKIVKVHGLKGYLKVQSFSEGDLFDYPEFFDEKGKLIDIQYQSALKNNTYLVTMPGIESSVKAQPYIGIDLYVDRQPLEEGEFYFSDLVGLLIYDEDAIQLGTIHEIRDFGASPFIIIKKEDNVFLNAFFYQDSIVSIDDDKVVIKKEFIV